MGKISEKAVIKYMVENSGIEGQVNKNGIMPVTSGKLAGLMGAIKRPFVHINVHDKAGNINKIETAAKQLTQDKFKNALIFERSTLELLDEKSVAHIYSFLSSLQTWESQAIKHNGLYDKKRNDLIKAREEYEAIIDSLDQTVPSISKAAQMDPSALADRDRKNLEELKLAFLFMGIELQLNPNTNDYEPVENATYAYHAKDGAGNPTLPVVLSVDAADAFCKNFMNKSADERAKISVAGVFKYFVNQDKKSLPAEDKAIVAKRFSVDSPEWKAFKLSKGSSFVVADAISSAGALYGKGLIDQVKDQDFDFSSDLESDFNDSWHRTRRLDRLGNDMDNLILAAVDLGNSFDEIAKENIKDFDSAIKQLETRVDLYKKENKAAELKEAEAQLKLVRESKNIYSTVIGITQMAIVDAVANDPNFDVAKGLEDLKKEIKEVNGAISYTGNLNWLSKQNFDAYLKVVQVNPAQFASGSILANANLQAPQANQNVQNNQTVQASQTAQVGQNTAATQTNGLPDVLLSMVDGGVMAPEGSLNDLLRKGAQYERLTVLLNSKENNPLKKVRDAWLNAKATNSALTAADFIKNIKQTDPSLLGDLTPDIFGDDTMLAECLDTMQTKTEPTGFKTVKRAYYYLDMVAKELAKDPGQLSAFEGADENTRKAIVQNIFNQKMAQNIQPTQQELDDAQARWQHYANYNINMQALDDINEQVLKDPNSTDAEKSVAKFLSKSLGNIVDNNIDAINNLKVNPMVDYENLPEKENVQAATGAVDYVKYSSVFPRERSQSQLKKMFKGYNIKYSLKKLQQMLDILDKVSIIDPNSPSADLGDPNSTGSAGQGQQQQGGAQQQSSTQQTSTQQSATQNASVTQTQQQAAPTASVWSNASTTNVRSVAANQMIALGINEALNNMTTIGQDPSKTIDEQTKAKIKDAVELMTNPDLKSDAKIHVPGSFAKETSIGDAMLRAYYNYSAGYDTGLLYEIQKCKDLPDNIKEGIAALFQIFPPEQTLSLLTASSQGQIVNGQKSVDWIFGAKIDDAMCEQLKTCQNVGEMRKMIESTPELRSALASAVTDIQAAHNVPVKSTTTLTPEQEAARYQQMMNMVNGMRNGNPNNPYNMFDGRDNGMGGM